MESGTFSPAISEEQRLVEASSRHANWQRWGTYLPERQWGTVREDDSADGNPWEFTYDMARYKAYRWGEDGLLGWTDRECRLCFSTSLWNGKDTCLKERLFGLSNPQGNHGEDVKELYFYLDATPTHSYAKGLYKYPQAAFPYEELLAVNKSRSYNDPEFELLDTKIFDESRYFDVEIEYAKQAPDDILIRLSITNRGPEQADLTVVPTLLFRNTWTFPTPEDTGKEPPLLSLAADHRSIRADHGTLGEFILTLLPAEERAAERIVFTNNETNLAKTGGAEAGPHRPAKDAFDDFVVRGDSSGLRPDERGTKAAFISQTKLASGACRTIRLRLASAADIAKGALTSVAFDQVIQARIREADEFYRTRIPEDFTAEERRVARQAYAGLLWSKQFYFYVGSAATIDPRQQTAQTEPERKRNEKWPNLFCRDVLSMPDKWEYPWFAAWDSGFQLVALAHIDPNFAKQQSLLFMREWYMRADGQLPAYEYKFSDVNPPVHAWSVLSIYRRDAKQNHGKGDLGFLERAFQKLMFNFAWWVNRLDPQGNNLFGGGFLGLDNVGILDRSALPPEARLSQADGTAWMGFFCATMLAIALELAELNPVYEDVATKFFHHYVAIIDAFNGFAGKGLWDEEEGFFFDQLISPGKPPQTLGLRSIVGIVPLYALCILPKHQAEKLPEIMERIRWFQAYRPDITELIGKAQTSDPAWSGSFFVSLVQQHRLDLIAKRLFDDSEFLSSFGIRSLSKSYAAEPYQIDIAGLHYTVRYTPAEGDSGMFGGNSNWRGPVWFPVNVLLVEAMERYALLLGDDYTLEYPAGSGQQRSLRYIAADLSRRLVSLFLPDASGRRPCHGQEKRYSQAGPWKDLLLFNEYFSGDDGRGVGASHQTGWTGIVPLCMETMHRLSKSAGA